MASLRFSAVHAMSKAHSTSHRNTPASIQVSHSSPEGAPWNDRIIPFLPSIEWRLIGGPEDNSNHEGDLKNFSFHLRRYRSKAGKQTFSYAIVRNKLRKGKTRKGNEKQEVIAFSVFLSHLEREGFVFSSDIPMIQEITDMLKSMPLLSLKACHESWWC